MVETSCADCVFAKIKDNKQYGCVLNRTDKLETRKEKTGDLEHDVVLRFCNTSRPEAWTESLSLEEKLQADSVVMEEVRPRVGFLIYVDHSKDNPIESLDITLQSIKNQTESCARYVIVANEKVEYNEQIHEMLLSYFDKDLTDIHILQLIEVPENKVWILDEAFRLALNGWIYTTTSGEMVDKNVLKDVHEHLNIKMKKLSVVSPYEGINGLMVQTSLFKYLNGNRTKIWSEDQKDSRLFLDKVKELDKTEDCILDWSQVNVT